MNVTSLACPLCDTWDLNRTGTTEYHCARMHGAFRLRGTADAGTGLVKGWLEHAGTGLRYDLGAFTATAWERLVGAGAGDGDGTR